MSLSGRRRAPTPWSTADAGSFAGYGFGGPGPGVSVPEPERIVIPGLAFNYFTPFVSPAYLESADLERQPAVYFGRADHDLDRSEADAIASLWSYDIEAQVFASLDRPSGSLEVFTDCQCGRIEWLKWVRLATIGGTLLLMTLIITLGMALWAAEGRDERDTLVAIGASPSVLARIAAAKAWAIAFGNARGSAVGFRHAAPGRSRSARADGVPVGVRRRRHRGAADRDRCRCRCRCRCVGVERDRATGASSVGVEPSEADFAPTTLLVDHVRVYDLGF